MLDTFEDKDLLAALQAGDNDAMAELYERHASSMFQLAYRILQNQRDAEDLIHDVFIEAWRKSYTYHPKRGSVRNWLLIRVRSRGIDRLRSLKVARNHGMMEAETQTAGVDDNAAVELVDQVRVHDSLNSLPEAQRQVVELSYFQGLSCSDIAEQYNIPLGTVKSRLQAGVNKLRQRLAPTRSKANE